MQISILYATKIYYAKNIYKFDENMVNILGNRLNEYRPNNKN